tara:strand:- start:4368 stop:6779 length:2412 start_codon:yes stop_codon:yes gene_type:complete
MGCLTKSSLSALSSCAANLCPADLDLDQFSRTFNGNFNLNFVTALSGAQSFKNLNFTNFYLTNNVLLDDITTFNSAQIKPTWFSSSLLFANTGHSNEAYLKFTPATLDSFEASNVWYDAQFYGSTSITDSNDKSPDIFEITIIDSFTCRVAIVKNNFRYYLVVSDDPPVQHGLPEDTKYVLFVGENKLPMSGFTLEYNFAKHGNTSYINLFSTKGDDKYNLQSDGKKIVAVRIDTATLANEFYFINKSIRLDQEINFNVLSPYNASFITYNFGKKINNDKSNFQLTSNYLLYSSSNNPCLNFNLLNLKNIANTQDQFTSSNTLLSTPDANVFCENLREYTSIFSDIDSEKNEVLSLNFVYNNYDINIKPGTTYFTTPSSIAPFNKLNINDTKFTDCGAFAFPAPDFADKVYNLDDDSVKAENVTYLCTWLSGGVGERGIWVDRYFYPDLVSKEAALAGSPSYNITYTQAVENLIKSNSSLKTSVTRKRFFDKKSDLTFEPQKRYKYSRISSDILVAKSPTNFCETVVVKNKVNKYFSTINKNGGFGLGFTLQSDSRDFSLESGRNAIDGGFSIKKIGKNISFTYKIFDNSTSGDLSINERIQQTTFEYDFDIDRLEKNNIFLSFNTILGVCNLYLNAQKLYTFNINAYQMLTKRIVFGDLYIQEIMQQTAEDTETETGAPIEILRNAAGQNPQYIENLYLTLSPLTEIEELAAVFSTDLDRIQDISISLPCGMRNMTDNIQTVNSINTNLKNKSNVVDINIKNLNITEDSITDEVKNILKTNISNSLPKTTEINNITFVDYKS